MDWHFCGVPVMSAMSQHGCPIQEAHGAGLVCSHRYDRPTKSEVDPHLEELLDLVVWLTTCGRSELKVFDSVTYPQLEGFKFHHEASGGSSYVYGGLVVTDTVPCKCYTGLLLPLCGEMNTWLLSGILLCLCGDYLWI